jgi:hypothetical protein
MARSFKALVGAFYFIACLGGIWFGLFSCGGYAWHKQLMHWSLVVLATIVVAFPPWTWPATWRRLLLALGLFVAFYLSRAMTAPFYLGVGSLQDYVSQVLTAISYGPC